MIRPDALDQTTLNLANLAVEAAMFMIMDGLTERMLVQFLISLRNVLALDRRLALGAFGERFVGKAVEEAVTPLVGGLETPASQ